MIQKKAIVDFVRSGKGLVGVHCATVMMYDFPEYGEMLGGYYFNSIFTPLLGNDVPVNHRHIGVLKVEDNAHPATRMFASSWPRSPHGRHSLVAWSGELRNLTHESAAPASLSQTA